MRSPCRWCGARRARGARSAEGPTHEAGAASRDLSTVVDTVSGDPNVGVFEQHRKPSGSLYLFRPCAKTAR
jgi:hypothetical protein